MKVSGMARLGTDMVVKYLPNGDPVGEVSLAFKLSRKDKNTGEYGTTWVNAALFGKRAESLAQYLTKGSQHCFYLKDLMADEFVGKDGNQRSTLKAFIEDVELVGGKSDGAKPDDRAAKSRAAMDAQKLASGGGGFDDMEDDIPF